VLPGDSVSKLRIWSSSEDPELPERPAVVESLLSELVANTMVRTTPMMASTATPPISHHLPDPPDLGGG
jgi:hypothetical protein